MTASHFAALAAERKVLLRHHQAFVAHLDLEFVQTLLQRAYDHELVLAVRGGGDKPGRQPGAKSGFDSHDKLSFFVTMLVHLDLASRADMLSILDYFNKMDIDQDGEISVGEILEEHSRISIERKARKSLVAPDPDGSGA